MLVAASAADTPRHETRYVFFLYPLALIVALTGVFQGMRLLLKERIAGGAAAPSPPPSPPRSVSPASS